MNSLDLLSAVG